MSVQSIIIAVGSACALAWGVFTELRMQRLQRADEELKRQVGDNKIEKEVHAESDSQLISDLTNITKGS